MATEIQLDNIFLECSEFEQNPHETGETRRSPWSGKVFTQTPCNYNSFELRIEGLSPSMHSNLLYLVSKNRDYDGSAPENLTLVDDVGNSYTVTIPVEGYDFNREGGDIESYWWTLELEEVL